MPVAGVVVTPLKREFEKSLADKLRTLPGANVEGIGEKGIALILEARSVDALHEMSEAINQWDEVADFMLAYLNWEDNAEAQQTIVRRQT